MESVSEVEAAADRLASEAGLDEDQRFHVTMAVREAAVNAVLHGNEYDPAKKMTASFENTGTALVFTISDQGKGLDPATLPDPLAPENLLRGTGRGIFLIRSFMDEVHFRQLHPADQASGPGWRVNLGHLCGERRRRTDAGHSRRRLRQDLTFPSGEPVRCYNRNTNKEEIPWH
jgi:serine/threonine-protein kinase RsbW